MEDKDYKDLQVWRKGLDITDNIYAITKAYPNDETYCLVSQMRRAAISIPSNIAEGFARHYTREYTRFLYISLGSCAELDTHLEISLRRKYISPDELMELSENINHEVRMLSSLIRKLKRIPSHETRITKQKEK
jgi:four helix bundle protein